MSTNAILPSQVTGQSAPVAFLKIAEIKGEGWNKQHEGEIGVLAWSWDEEHRSTVASTTKERPKVVMGDLKFITSTSTASPQLMVCCASGRRFKTAVLTCADTKGASILNYLTITLSDVVVTSYDVSMPVGSSDPIDTVGLGFRKIEFSYVGTKQDHSTGGTSHSSWDLGTNSQG